MRGCEGVTVFDLLRVVLRRKSKAVAMIMRRREVWLTAGTLTLLFRSVPSVAHVHLTRISALLP
jgi:hypothetical protein